MHNQCILLHYIALNDVLYAYANIHQNSSKMKQFFIYFLFFLIFDNISLSVAYKQPFYKHHRYDSIQTSFKRDNYVKKYKNMKKLSNFFNLHLNHERIDTSMDSLPSTSPNISFGFNQIEPFIKIAVPYFQQDKNAKNSLILLIFLTLMNAGVSIVFSYVSKDFYNALNVRDEALFYEEIQKFFIALLIAVPISVFYRFLREKISLSWREGLTNMVLDQYYANRTYYIIETMKEIDNPDQRLSEDIRTFTRTSLDFFITIFTAIIDLISFSTILFDIYPALFGAIIMYAGLGSLITSKIGSSLIQLNYQRLQREANFRFSLIRTRENSESIAFYDPSAKLEKNSVLALFDEVRDNQLNIINTQRNLEGFTTAYRYLPNILVSS